MASAFGLLAMYVIGFGANREVWTYGQEVAMMSEPEEEEAQEEVAQEEAAAEEELVLEWEGEEDVTVDDGTVPEDADFAWTDIAFVVIKRAS